MAAQCIFTFFQSLRLGGVERSALRHMREWVAAGRGVRLYCGTIEGAMAAEVPDGVIVEHGRSIAYVDLFRPVIAAVRRAQPDIVFIAGNHYTAIAAVMRLVLGRDCPPIVAKISNIFARPDLAWHERIGYNMFLHAHVGLIDHFVALSELSRVEAMRAAGGRPEKFSVIADPPCLPSAPAAAIEPARPTIVAVGRMTPQKRLDRLVAAFARVPAALGAELVLIGDGPERPRVEAAVAMHRLEDRVRLVGYLADPTAIMAGARALALSSSYEGLPAVVREALAVGTPVVTTASSPALGEVLTDARLGEIVPLGDIAALAAAMARRLSTAPDRAWIRANAGGGDWPAAAARYLALFDAVALARRRGAAGRIAGNTTLGEPGALAAPRS